MAGNVYALSNLGGAGRRAFDPLMDARLKPMLRSYFRFPGVDIPRTKRQTPAYYRFAPVCATRLVGGFASEDLIKCVRRNPNWSLLIQAIAAGWVWDDPHTLDTLTNLLTSPRSVLAEWLTELRSIGHADYVSRDDTTYWLPTRKTMYRYIEVVAGLADLFETIAVEHTEVFESLSGGRDWIDTDEPLAFDRTHDALEAQSNF